jgi:hypothetical protein
MTLLATSARPMPCPCGILPKPGPLSSTMTMIMLRSRLISTATTPDGPAARVALLSKFEMVRRRMTGSSAHRTDPGGDVTDRSPGQVNRQASTASLTTPATLTGPSRAPFTSF